MPHPTRNPQRNHSHSPHAYVSHPPSGLDKSKPEWDAERDAELAKAIASGIERFGADHPLVAKALSDLRRKEARRQQIVAPDALSSCTSQRPRGNRREDQSVALVARLLGEEPKTEVQLPGFGRRRVDALFLEHRLVVEENGANHRPRCPDRDRELGRICSAAGIRLLIIFQDEPLTEEHMSRRLLELGVSLA